MAVLFFFKWVFPKIFFVFFYTFMQLNHYNLALQIINRTGVWSLWSLYNLQAQLVNINKICGQWNCMFVFSLTEKRIKKTYISISINLKWNNFITINVCRMFTVSMLKLSLIIYVPSRLVEYCASTNLLNISSNKFSGQHKSFPCFIGYLMQM